MATLRAEIFRGEPLESVICSTTVPVTGAASSPWSPPYAAGDADRYGNPHKTVTFEAFGGPIYVAVGEAPNPAAEPRRLVRPGLKIAMHIQAGDRVSAVAAADIPA